MPRSTRFRCRANLLIGAVVILAGCGSNQTGQEIPSPAPAITVDQRDTDWFTSIDPLTGRDFRCTLWWKSGTQQAGMASWCYEPVEGEVP